MPEHGSCQAMLVECGCFALSLVLLLACKPKLPMALQRLLRKLRIDVAVERFERFIAQVRVVILILASAILTWDLSACFTAALVDETVADLRLVASRFWHRKSACCLVLTECFAGALVVVLGIHYVRVYPAGSKLPRVI
jgi:hypothetical protein